MIHGPGRRTACAALIGFCAWAPARAASILTILNHSDGTLAVSLPWNPGPWGFLSGSHGFQHRLLAPGTRASFRFDRPGQALDADITIRTLGEEGRFTVEGLEIRALEHGFVPIGDPPEPDPESPPSGRLAPVPGPDQPD